MWLISFRADDLHTQSERWSDASDRHERVSYALHGINCIMVCIWFIPHESLQLYVYYTYKFYSIAYELYARFFYFLLGNTRIE